MHIRTGTPEDASALAGLISSFQALLTLDPSGAGAEQYLASVSEEAERQYLHSHRYNYFVSEVQGDIAGFIAMRDSTHLFHLFVANKHQGQGLARALWSHARERATSDRGACEFTVNSSLNAVVVYERFGFVRSGVQVQTHGIAFVPMKLTVTNDT